MSEPIAQPEPVDSALLQHLRQAHAPFFGALDPVTVPEPVVFSFEGSFSADHVAAIWTWVMRDLAPRIAVPVVGESATETIQDTLIAQMRATEAHAVGDNDHQRRLIAQLGGDAARERLPTVVAALECRQAIAEALRVGRLGETMSEPALTAAIRTFTARRPPLAALLGHAMLVGFADPARLVMRVTAIAGDESDTTVMRAGLAPLIEAVLANAQSQLSPLFQEGPFADVDLVCRAIERFHQLIRPVTSCMALGSRSRWLTVAGGLTRLMSERIERRLADLIADMNLALRPREGTDRLDRDRILAALSGCYLLKTARDCRDSLALNRVIDLDWEQIGQVLELHIERNLARLRQEPDDRITAARLEAAIKMSELRFGQDYANVMRRARDRAERRLA